MILIVSHFTKNKGTTDYFRDYLISKKVKHYYLRHPFTFINELLYSELVYFDGNKEKVISKYRKISIPALDMMRNFLVSFYVSLKLNKRVHKVFAFGSFNTLPFIIFKQIFKRDIVFWGVDYSTKRFDSSVLNKIYVYTETAACLFADSVFNLTKRQETARIANHKLDKQKSSILPSGIHDIDFKKDFTKYQNISLLYIGSITRQHGIVDFVKRYYIDGNIQYPIYIYGGGESVKEMVDLIEEHKISKLVKFYGVKNQNQIKNFISSLDERVFGIAPYNKDHSDHVYYGDSLKVREYLNYNIPFIVPNFLYVADELVEFGLTYKNFQELDKLLLELDKFIFNKSKKYEVLKKYNWKNIFNEIIL